MATLECHTTLHNPWPGPETVRQTQQRSIETRDGKTGPESRLKQAVVTGTKFAGVLRTNRRKVHQEQLAAHGIADNTGKERANTEWTMRGAFPVLVPKQ